MDAAVAAELRATLAVVGELWARYEKAARRPTAFGSPAATDAALPQSRFVSIHAAQSLVSGLDHLAAWRMLVEGGTLPIEAQMTLLRGALEGAARCRWLLDPTVDATTRVARGFAAKRDDYRERGNFEKADGRDPRADTGAMTADERLAELEGWRQQAGIPLVSFDRTTDLMKVYRLEGIFRTLSAAAHGKEWVLAAGTLDERSDPPAPPGVGHGVVSANDRLVLGMTEVVVLVVTRAVAAFEAYKSPATDQHGG